VRNPSTSSLVLALSVLVLAGTQLAPAGSGGSSYSILGLGDLRYPTGVRSAGMGYTGIALPNPGYVNPLAPGTWSRFNRTRFEASVQYEGFGSTDGQRSRYLARMDFYGGMLAIPFSQEDGIALVAGFVPYSTLNYDSYVRSTYTSPTDTMDYLVHNVGNGGISQGLLGLSYAPVTSLALGFSLNYLFGTLDAEATQVPFSTSYSGGNLTQRATINGLTVTIGGTYTGLGDLTPALRPVTVGFVFTTKGAMTSRMQNIYKFTNDLITSERDTTTEIRSATSIPISYGIGLAYQASERTAIAADFFAQPWSSSEINGSAPASLRNSYRIGIGVERGPAKEMFPGLTERASYRFGTYYHATYAAPSGYPVNEWGITAGVGLPISGDTRVNIALEYAHRGSTENGLIRDNIFRLTASLNIGALWFARYEED
jgi:hypothetical protein